MEPDSEVTPSRVRKVLAKAIMLAGAVTGMAVGFAVARWLWPVISIDRPMTRGWWNEQSWTLIIWFIVGMLVFFPFAWVSDLSDPNPPANNKTSD